VGGLDDPLLPFGGVALASTAVIATFGGCGIRC